MADQDYQQQMGEDTRSIDQMANEEAESKTVANFGAGKEWVSQTNSSGFTYKTMEGVFGMLPAISLPLDHAIERKASFNTIALAHKDNGWGDAPSGKSLKAMAANYNDDIGRLPTAERQYNLLAPLANMAARAYAKADSVGAISDKEWSLDSGMTDNLDAKEEKAIKGAVTAERMSKANSLQHASGQLGAARLALDGASHIFAKVANDTAMASLEAAMKTHEDKKAEIEASKAKVLKYVGFVETAGSLIAGGAGMAAGKAEAVMTDDMRSDGIQGVEKAGEKVSGGMLSSAVSFGIDLINHNELARLDNRIDMIKGELASYSALNKWHDVEAAKSNFHAAVATYATAVSVYNATVQDRRTEMAAIGAAADKSVDKKGKDHDASQAVLWMEVVMELQVHLQTALGAGVQANTTISQAKTDVDKTRKYAYGVADEHYTGNNRPHNEIEIMGGRGGPDADALANMSELTNYWVEAATRVAALVDSTVATNMAPFMASSGFSGQF